MPDQKRWYDYRCQPSLAWSSLLGEKIWERNLLDKQSQKVPKRTKLCDCWDPGRDEALFLMQPEWTPNTEYQGSLAGPKFKKPLGTWTNQQVTTAVAVTISVSISSQQPRNDPNLACRGLNLSLGPSDPYSLASLWPTDMLSNVPTPRLSPCSSLHLQCLSRQWLPPFI